jgi:hypothetical protein
MSLAKRCKQFRLTLSPLINEARSHCCAADQWHSPRNVDSEIKDRFDAEGCAL